jgi:hypothetical protein
MYQACLKLCHSYRRYMFENHIPRLITPSPCNRIRQMLPANRLARFPHARASHSQRPQKHDDCRTNQCHHTAPSSTSIHVHLHPYQTSHSSKDIRCMQCTTIPFQPHADIGKRTLLCVCVCLLQHAEIHVFDAPHVPHKQRPTLKLLWGDTRVCNGDERTCKARSAPLARAFPSRSCICVERVNGTCMHEGGARDRWGGDQAVG